MKIYKTFGILISFLIVFLVYHVSWAGDDMNQQLSQILEQNRMLQERLDEVEKRLAVFEGQKVSEPAATEKEEKDSGFLSDLKNRVTFSGLIEFGGVYQDIKKKGHGNEDKSDLALTTVELGLGFKLNDWVSAEATLLYEDATFGEESSLDVDVAAVTFGNTEKYPLYLTVGKMYVPFGALLTHFPDDPLWDSPVTLTFGETSEKAALLGLSYKDITLSAYAFNGDMEEKDSDNSIDSYGFDANFSHHVELPLGGIWGKGERFKLEDVCGGYEILLGASYISNIAESDGMGDALGLDELEDQIGGAAAYLHLGYRALFLDAEYMTAIKDFEPMELAQKNGKGARPSVWNIEAGFNVCTFSERVLEVAFQYAGSDETEGLGFPESRYGLNFNQELFENVTLSLGYAHDEFHDGTYDEDGREVEDRDIVFSQVAVEF